MDTQGYIASKSIPFNYDLKIAPRGTKMILLTSGGVSFLGQVTGDPKKDIGIWAWSPMPGRDRQKEEELGLTSLPKGFTAPQDIQDETLRAVSTVTSNIHEINDPGSSDSCDTGSPLNISTGNILPQRSNELPEMQQQSSPSTPAASS